MSENKHPIDELAAYALGVLDHDEAAVVSRHLADCELCRAELGEFEAVVDSLALAASPASPDPGLKTRLMAQIRKKRKGSVDTISWQDRLRLWLQRPIPAWQVALVGAVLVVAVALSLIAGPGELENFGRVALAATENAPGATGILIISADGEYGSLVVQGLPDLDPEHQYQLWLIDNGERTSGGVFSVEHGYAAIEVHAPRFLSSYQSFGITIEPAGGSSGPTGAKVLGST
jgi:anti-sigma-K factor RskA